MDVTGRKPELVDDVRPVAEQSTVVDEKPQGVDGRQPMPCRQCNDQRAVSDRLRRSRHDQPAVRGSCKGRDRALDLFGIAQANAAQFHPERRRHGLDGGELGQGTDVARLQKDRRARDTGSDFLKQLQPFRAHPEFGRNETGGVAAWPCQTFDEANADRVGRGGEHDWDATVYLLQGQNRRIGVCEDDIRFERDQLRRVAGNLAVVDGKPGLDA